MIGIVVVVYKSFNDTVNFIKNEITKLDSVPLKLVIVDNAAKLEESKRLANYCQATLVNEMNKIDKNDRIFVISEKENLGYAKGNNLGAKFLNDNFEIEYLVFSNNDIEFTDKDVLQKLKHFLKKEDQIALVGPMIQTPDGGLHPGHTKHVSIIRRIAWNFLPFLRKKKKTKTVKRKLSSPYECSWVSGCFFMIKNRAFIEINGFDNGTFLYGEEIIISERLKRIYYKTYFLPDAIVLHNHNQTIGKKFNDYKIQELQMTSHSYYYKNYKNTPQVLLWLYKVSFKFRFSLN